MRKLMWSHPRSIRIIKTRLVFCVLADGISLTCTNCTHKTCTHINYGTVLHQFSQDSDPLGVFKAMLEYHVVLPSGGNEWLHPRILELLEDVTVLKSRWKTWRAVLARSCLPMGLSLNMNLRPSSAYSSFTAQMSSRSRGSSMTVRSAECVVPYLLPIMSTIWVVYIRRISCVSTTRGTANPKRWHRLFFLSWKRV